MTQLVDNFGRIHDYLRISITDRCNLRCQYCMGPDGVKLLNSEEILSYEEIVTIVKTLAPMGVKGLRLTGGEPLVRKDIEHLVSSLAATPGIEDIGLTTNGQLLPEKAKKLQAAGLNRINISLDSLNEHKYSTITRGGSLKNVLKGIYEALEADLQPVKINVVLMQGFNDDEIPDFLKMAAELPIHTRFIEYMPIGGHDDEWRKNYLSLTSVMEVASSMGLTLIPDLGIKGNKTAKTFRINQGQGTIGLIHPVSKHFCSSCTRLRLTADGKIKTCLFWPEEVRIRPYINDQESLRNVILNALAQKTLGHKMGEMLNNDEQQIAGRLMSQIGG